MPLILSLRGDMNGISPASNGAYDVEFRAVTKRFGSLDAALSERCAFELRIFRFADARPA